MRDFHQLQVWEKAGQLALQAYLASEAFPARERYSLTSQLCRAALSFPTNIVEGCGRDSEPQFVHFLKIALGSASECEYLLFFAQEVAYLAGDQYIPL